MSFELFQTLLRDLESINLNKFLQLLVVQDAVVYIAQPMGAAQNGHICSIRLKVVFIKYENIGLYLLMNIHFADQSFLYLSDSSKHISSA